MMIERLWITLAAVNLEAIVSFYTKVLGQDPDFYQIDRYAEFNLHHCRLGIFKPQRDQESLFAPAATSPMSLCLTVTDLEASRVCLQQAGATLGNTIVSSHGQEINAYDPLGNRIIIYQSNQSKSIG